MRAGAQGQAVCTFTRSPDAGPAPFPLAAVCLPGPSAQRASEASHVIAITVGLA